MGPPPQTPFFHRRAQESYLLKEIPIATVGMYTRWAAIVCKSILPAVFCCLGAMYGACLSPFFNRMLGASYGGAMVHRQKNTGTWKGQRKSDSHNGSFRAFLASNIPLVYEIHWNFTQLWQKQPQDCTFQPFGPCRACWGLPEVQGSCQSWLCPRPKPEYCLVLPSHKSRFQRFKRAFTSFNIAWMKLKRLKQTKMRGCQGAGNDDRIYKRVNQGLMRKTDLVNQKQRTTPIFIWGFSNLPQRKLTISRITKTTCRNEVSNI